MTLLSVLGCLRSGFGPLLVTSLPVVMAFAMTFMGSRPQVMGNVPELPGLSFDQYLVDLREVAPTEEIFAVFDFKNTGANTITVNSLVPSCGCLSPRMEKMVYKPGENGSFLLRIKTALQRPGPKEFSVKVNYTDTQPRSREVYLKAVFPAEQIYVKPMSLTFHQLGSSPVSQEIIVTDLRTTPAEIIGVESSSDFMNVEVLGVTTAKSGAQQQRVRVTVPGSVPSGKQTATIKIFTNDERFYELKVPVQIFGLPRHTSPLRMAGPQPLGGTGRY